MSTRYRVLRNAGAGALFAVASIFAWSVSGQSEADNRLDAKYLNENMIFFMAACDGEPNIIPLSKNSPRLIASNAYSAGSTLKRVTWIEPNCSVLFTNIDDVSTSIIPDRLGFSSMTVVPGLLQYFANGLKSKGEPHSLSDVLVNSDPLSKIYFYTDFDISGSFEPSELLNTENLAVGDVKWDYSYNYITEYEFIEPFLNLKNYEENGSVVLKIAEFVRGPLDQRQLYLLATTIETN